MSEYVEINTNVNIDDFLSLFKKLYNLIKDKFSKDESEDTVSFEELVEIKSADTNFLNYLEYIKTSLSDIADLMEEINFINYEYENFISIKKMITYIVDDVNRYLKYDSFILTLLTAFNNLMDSYNAPNYENIYENFDIFLFEKENFFYTKIFEYTHEYDDLIDKVTNILR